MRHPTRCSPYALMVAISALREDSSDSCNNGGANSYCNRGFYSVQPGETTGKLYGTDSGTVYSYAYMIDYPDVWWGGDYGCEMLDGSACADTFAVD